MRSRFGCQQTNRPKVDAGRTAARKVKNRRRTITRKTTAKQIEANLEHLELPHPTYVGWGFLRGF